MRTCPKVTPLFLIGEKAKSNKKKKSGDESYLGYDTAVEDKIKTNSQKP